jgi:hypothetical protein
MELHTIGIDLGKTVFHLLVLTCAVRSWCARSSRAHSLALPLCEVKLAQDWVELERGERSSLYLHFASIRVISSRCS